MYFLEEDGSESDSHCELKRWRAPLYQVEVIIANGVDLHKYLFRSSSKLTSNAFANILHLEGDSFLL